MSRYIKFDDTDTRQKLIEAIPTIEPKRGEWIHDIAEVSEFSGMLLPNCKCSVCGCEVQCEANFCPNCGADMRGADDEDN